MAYDYTVEKNYVSISLHGVVTAADLSEVARRLRETEAGAGITPHRITEMSRAVEIEMRFEQIDRYVQTIQAARWKNNARSAIVANTPLHFGLARMYQTMAENSQIEVNILPTVDAALQWIQDADQSATGKGTTKR